MRSYVELMGDVAYTPAATGGGIWIGVRPFVGRYHEAQEGTVTGPPPNPFGDRGPATVDATLYGALATIGASIPVGNLELWLEAGAGLYGVSATGHDSGIDQDFAANFGGFRAQLATGISRTFDSGFSIGLVTRAEYWSALPTLRWPVDVYFGQGIEPLEDTRIGTAPQWSVTFGVRVGFTFGG